MLNNQMDKYHLLILLSRISNCMCARVLAHTRVRTYLSEVGAATEFPEVIHGLKKQSTLI